MAVVEGVIAPVPVPVPAPVTVTVPGGMAVLSVSYPF